MKCLQIVVLLTFGFVFFIGEAFSEVSMEKIKTPLYKNPSAPIEQRVENGLDIA